MGKLRGDEIRRVLDHHDENLRSLALSFKDAADKDRSRAPMALREEVYTGMWRLADIRERMKAEIADLADYYVRDVPRPPDFGIRVIRLSVAMFALDKLDDMRKAVAKNPNTTLIALLEVARSDAEKLFGEGYFSLTQDGLIHAYLDAEPSLSSLAKCCNIPLPNLHEAVERYKLKVGQEIDSTVDAAFDAA